MARWRSRVSGTADDDTGAGYGPPSYARRPRRRLDIGVTGVLLTGFAAVGLAGFVTVAGLFDEDGTEQGAAGLPGTSADLGREEDGVRRVGRNALTDNRLYEGGELVEVECPAPELDPDDAASMETFLHTVTDCLDEAWTAQFGDSRMPFEPPNRIYWYTSGQSPCGTYPVEGAAAFYCQANKGLYLGVEDIVDNSADSRRPAAYTFLLSHEYAHHVQGEAGILDHFHAVRGAADTEAERDAWTRRSELQANCLGGVFLGTVDDSFPLGAREQAHILEDAELRGDYGAAGRTHGSPDNGRMWTAHGMDRRDPAACNTWEAGEELVQ
ncbi:hypothetical protein SAMN02745673_01215 [Marinactinospora thermotolerans DSM 45154]|uniref:Metalloprotease n=1 Tax=Marinactinospora thermotolerans DSM 45154 TaxID=1122192 RepID=A0A1T4MZX0_9ACTN|nr:neutral zinc metallopeptidase [Marinactinospora thermotolerans]SJZ72599.1 hypothetical protein SAMN02745673_01215 [Marinactinospora thermotolerans DSM 45154]